MSPIYDFTGPRNTQVPDGSILPQLVNHPDLNVIPQKFEDPINKDTLDVRNNIQAGFFYQDKAILNYFQDLVIPTLDATKKVDVRLAGGDRTILFWKQQYGSESGRIQLPVISINRTAIARDETRFSPAYVPVYNYFADRDGTRMVRLFREWPCNIEYQLSIWAERKRDLEYIAYLIITRFNPLAEWIVEDPQLAGRAQAKFGGFNITTDIDAAADKQAFQRADINITVMGWLPLPTYIITPTVLGKVATLNEDDGTILGTILDIVMVAGNNPG
jgi:hypothetical protein